MGKGKDITRNVHYDFFVSFLRTKTCKKKEKRLNEFNVPYFAMKKKKKVITRNVCYECFRAS